MTENLSDQSLQILAKLRAEQSFTADEVVKIRTGLEYLDTLGRAGIIIRWLANALVKAAAAVAAVYFLWNSWSGKS